MSDLNIRRALATLLISSGIPQSNIAWENKTFDPANLEYYVDFNYRPAGDTANGKLQVDSVDQEGFVQVSIFTKLNSGDYGTKFLEVKDLLKATFSSGLETSYNGQVVEIQDSTDIDPSDSESWYQGGLTINYQAFKARV